MTLAEYSFWTFAVLNGARLIAYVPQMKQIWRDPNGANAVSIATWIVFSAAHIATAFYAYAAANDLIVAAVFLLNAAGCFAIVVMTSMRRLEWHKAMRHQFLEARPQKSLTSQLVPWSRFVEQIQQRHSDVAPTIQRGERYS